MVVRHQSTTHRRRFRYSALVNDRGCIRPPSFAGNQPRRRNRASELKDSNAVGQKENARTSGVAELKLRATQQEIAGAWASARVRMPAERYVSGKKSQRVPQVDDKRKQQAASSLSSDRHYLRANVVKSPNDNMPQTQNWFVDAARSQPAKLIADETGRREVALSSRFFFLVTISSAAQRSLS